MQTIIYYFLLWFHIWLADGLYWSVCDNKSPPVSKTLLRILATRKHTIARMVYVLSLISSYASLFSNIFRTVPSTGTLINITITHIFFIYLFVLQQGSSICLIIKLQYTEYKKYYLLYASKYCNRFAIDIVLLTVVYFSLTHTHTQTHTHTHTHTYIYIYNSSCIRRSSVSYVDLDNLFTIHSNPPEKLKAPSLERFQHRIDDFLQNSFSFRIDIFCYNYMILFLSFVFFL